MFPTPSASNFLWVSVLAVHTEVSVIYKLKFGLCQSNINPNSHQMQIVTSDFSQKLLFVQRRNLFKNLFHMAKSIQNTKKNNFPFCIVRVAYRQQICAGNT